MELRDYLNVIRARKWIIIQVVVAVTLSALLVSYVMPRTYQGEATILVTDKDTGAAIFGLSVGDLTSQPERGLETQAQLMRLRPIAETVIRTLNLQESPDELLKRVSVREVGQTNVITLTATDRDPQRAADIANGFADAYVLWSRDAKRESIDAAANEVQTRLDEAKSQILALGKKIQASTNANEELTAELKIATDTYSTLAQKLEELRVNSQLEVGSGRVVSPAAVYLTPVSPKPLRNGVLGLAVGLVFGLGVAFLLEYVDNTIKNSEQAEKAYGAPVLGYIPAEKFAKGEKRRLSMIVEPGGAAAEAYRGLRNSLDFVNFQHDIKTLLVTSSAPAEGKSTVAANLATALSQAGAKVALVSCDFRRPTVDQFFNVSNTVGLSDVLLDRVTLKSALQRPNEQELLVLVPGKMPPNPSELLGSAKMSNLIKSLNDWADWVIVDSPPLLAVSDAAAVARWSDGVLLVTRGGVSTRQAAKNGRETLDKVGARIVGVVVWGLEGRSGVGGYGYYEGQYASHYYHAYYSEKPSDGVSEDAGGSANAGVASRAESVPATSSSSDVSSEEGVLPRHSGGRQAAQAMARWIGIVLLVIIVVVVIAGVFYLLTYFGWGIMGMAGVTR